MVIFERIARYYFHEIDQSGGVARISLAKPGAFAACCGGELRSKLLRTEAQGNEQRGLERVAYKPTSDLLLENGSILKLEAHSPRY